MRKTIPFVLCLVALLVLAPFAAAQQANLTSTTLSVAMTTSSGTIVRVASATGISVGDSLYVDRELMTVNAISGTTLTVRRGAGGTFATPHILGAVVYAGIPQYFTVKEKAGACTIANEAVTPVINVNNGSMYDCIGGRWVQVNGYGVKRTCYARYDFAKDGGAVGAITPKTTCSIPNNAIITAVVINSTTAVTSGGAATVAIGTTAGSSATALIGATAIATFAADALVVGVPDPSTAATWVKMSAVGKVNVTVAVADLTAGVIEVFVDYFLATN